MNTRSALKTTTLPTGGGPDGLSPILIRKGEAVGYCVYAMHRRKDLYGPDAASFRPSRWDSDNLDGPNLKGIGWGYLPFNGGPRVCPGRMCFSQVYRMTEYRFTDKMVEEFALLEASYTVIRMLQSFRHIERVDPLLTEEKHTLTLVVANANGCKVVLTS